MNALVFWAIVFCISTAGSIVLLGDRQLISGNLFEYRNFIHLVTHYKFILAVLFALLARFSFILMNNTLLGIDRLSGNSTTITAFISSFAFLFITLANYLFLHERLNIQQMIGAGFIIVGIWFIVK
jgi:drug/metabolite transporter (DMT)-like permease